MYSQYVKLTGAVKYTKKHGMNTTDEFRDYGYVFQNKIPGGIDCREIRPENSVTKGTECVKTM
jgi:hypothetical protein